MLNNNEQNENAAWSQKILNENFNKKISELKTLHSKLIKKEENEELDVGSSLSSFRIISELGRGSYGVVYKVQSLSDSRDYVLKKINIKHLKPKQQNLVLKEVLILKKVRHPHIIRYYNSFIEEDSLYIVMEYAEGGDLHMVYK